MMQLRDHTNQEWVFQEFQSSRQIDFQIAALQGYHVAIKRFEGVLQPIVYSGELPVALPHYSTDLNDAIMLFQELPNGIIHVPCEGWNLQWRVKFDYMYMQQLNEFGDTLEETICKAWVSWKQLEQRND